MVKCPNCKAPVISVRVEEKPLSGSSRLNDKARFGVCPRCQVPVVSEFGTSANIYGRIRSLLNTTGRSGTGRE